MACAWTSLLLLGSENNDDRNANALEKCISSLDHLRAKPIAHMYQSIIKSFFVSFIFKSESDPMNSI